MHPFTDKSANSFAALGEAGLLQLVRKRLANCIPPPPAGMGDDCAVLEPLARNLVTVDPILYRKHFDDTVPPEDAAAKLLKRNLSDIAAMGGIPREGFLSCLLPARTRVDWLERFCDGLAQACQVWGVSLNGGDIAAAEADLAFSLTLLGYAQQPALRGKASPGDLLLVTGELGGSIRGRHTAFLPRMAEGQWLAKQSALVSMIDLSDGLAKDLPALLADQGTSTLELDLKALPLSADALSCAQQSGRPAWQHALCDGEDYELAFALKAGTCAADFCQNWQRQFTTTLSLIGTVGHTQGNPRQTAAFIDISNGTEIHNLKGFWH